ncbi:glycosyl transferase family 1 [Petrotoga miotherma DSM 10691]|uniref:Glycosyl transferase family 1 n=1 Tax=Petrotoga miotherma DSM 10691 TaxID=1434326 RepID=A0A2K1PCQ5_9BACT|nr:glycosyltransferase family 4 protein [Petrotoga miotherma]PNS00562.1 glycosyl transferase family 1 [Petrotoga miotherma DSM 10691]
MNILLINNYFPPEIGAASHLYYYLAKELQKRGHDVYYLTGIPRYNVDKETYEEYKKRGKVFIENEEGIKLIRVKLPYIERHKFIRRGIEHFEIAYKMFHYTKSIFKGLRIDVSLVYSPPLTLYWTAKKLRVKGHIPFILNVQDLFPQEAIDSNIIKNSFIIKFFKNMEFRAYETADLITVSSQKNKEFVEEVCKETKKVVIVEHWIDENEITPGPKENAFSNKFNFHNKFVVSFAGTLGKLQDIRIILNSAKLLEDYKEIVFLIVGDGIKKEESEKIAEKMKLKNVIFVPLQPKNIYPQILNSSDISLATLEKEVETPTIPSKILSIMSAGIPIIASMNLNGDAPKLIEKANAGYAVPAGDYKSMSKKILLLFKNKELKEELGKNGRKYIEEHLSVKTAADKYEKLFQEVIKTRKLRHF